MVLLSWLHEIHFFLMLDDSSVYYLDVIIILWIVIVVVSFATNTNTIVREMDVELLLFFPDPCRCGRCKICHQL